MSPDQPESQGPPLLTGAYEEWTFGRGAAYANLEIPLSAARFIVALVGLPPRAAPGELTCEVDLGQGDDGEPRTARILLPVIWRGLAAHQAQTTYWPALLDFSDPCGREALEVSHINRTLHTLSHPVRRALAAGGDEGGPSFRLNMPVRAESVSTSATEQPPYTADPALMAKLDSGGRPVIMAVIDDGIPFAHRNFRDGSGQGTRIEFCWLQSSDTAANGDVLFGREFTRDTINALVQDHGSDEDAIYLKAGAVEAGLQRTSTIDHFASHGAHVLDAAAGLRDDGAEADLDLLRIIAVQLPAAITADTSGFRKDAFVISALHYIFERADRFAAACLGDAAAPLPLVINFSYGFTGGPHDGTGTLEVAVSQLIAARQAQGKPTTLVMPSGNSFGERLNGDILPGKLNTGAAFPIPWRVQPNDHTSSYLEIWLPAAGSATDFALHVTDPNGAACLRPGPLTFTPATEGAGSASPALSRDLLYDGQPIGRCMIARYNSHWTRILIALAPTEPDDPSLPAAPSGLWTIGLAKTGGADLQASVGCRIQRDNDPFGYTRGGRQSYFDDPLDQRFTDDGAPSRIENPPAAFVRRFGTLNGIATHGHVTVVSGCYGDTGRATEYGAAGPSRPPGAAAGPGDVRNAVVSDDSTALRGVLAAGTRTGSVARLSGTSVAAPQVARFLAIQSLLQVPVPMQAILPRYPLSPVELAQRPIRLG
jgi:hypothetical protein